ncbi:ARF GTPase-activating protein GIT1 isoform X2 [Oratosquilla oratoria]|uniref:ARF GTPase-activating protein GIT1 isoform X2 n=1 Tax=Oratosquilla oratoria TaxID=337810 RepID=UPI003F763474
MARLGAGARTKPRTLQDVCADCGAPEPGWASINRGILMCDECCSVHRSLGRHVSQVKSLKKATWNPTLLTMVHRVNSSGANNIWEHTLLDPSHAKTGRRKPQPKDPVHPTKADFIRAKHQMLSFVYRPSREDPAGAEGDVSRQLHSSVRTANLETSLRLLSLGADPNFYHPEKGCCPIHVASRAGQAMQVELLIVYGADPGAVDGQGNSPSHYASEGGYPEIAARLEECQYELTDSLAFYLCGRKPDHISGQHWIIPEMADSLDMSDLAKEARVKLQNLPNHLFEELACDVYDEVDRRETDSIWLSLQNQSALVSDRCTVPFLPVNPEYSSTRNQGRQKLARFNAREFATLIIDVLSDCKRRQTGISSPATTPKDKEPKDVTLLLANSTKVTPLPNNNNNTTLNNHNLLQSNCKVASNNIVSNNTNTLTTVTAGGMQLSDRDQTAQGVIHVAGAHENDDEPLYDSVASEDDYTYLENIQKLSQQREILAEQHRQKHPCFMEAVDYADVNQEKQEGEKSDAVSLQEYLAMKTKLETSEARIKELQENNDHMRAELSKLSSTVSHLIRERSFLQAPSPQPKVKKLSDENTALRSSLQNPSYMRQQQHQQQSLQRPSHLLPLAQQSGMTQSMHNGYYPPQETRLASPSNLATSIASAHKPLSEEIMCCCLERVSLRGGRSLVPGSQRPFSMFEARDPASTESCQQMHTYISTHTPPQPPDLYGSLRESDDYDNPPDGMESCLDASLPEPNEHTPLSPSGSQPTQEEVVRKTEMITRRIQELLCNAQEGRQDAFVPCADQIREAVQDMADIFPKNCSNTGLQGAVRQLVISANRLSNECRGPLAPHNHHNLDPRFVTQQVIQCAYDIAKAAKMLVTHFQ